MIALFHSPQCAYHIANSHSLVEVLLFCNLYNLGTNALKCFGACAGTCAGACASAHNGTPDAADALLVACELFREGVEFGEQEGPLQNLLRTCLQGAEYAYLINIVRDALRELYALLGNLTELICCCLGASRCRVQLCSQKLQLVQAL